MRRRHALVLECAFAFALVGGANALGQQSSPEGARITVEGVVQLWTDHVPEDVIITMIKKNAKAFNLSQDEYKALKDIGISDTVIKFLIDPSQPYTPPAPAAASPGPKPDAPVRPKQYPADARAGQVPADPGLYQPADSGFQKTEMKTVLGETQGAGFGKVVMRKGKVVGYLLSPTAKTRIKDPMPDLYLRLPEGKMIEEVVLVALSPQKDRREIELGALPDKQELKAESMRLFEHIEVGPRLFKITAGKLRKGEYIFFLLGSAEPAKGSFGKGFDFGFDEARR